MNRLALNKKDTPYFIFWHAYLLAGLFLGGWIAQASSGIFQVNSDNVNLAIRIESWGVYSSIFGFWLAQIFVYQKSIRTFPIYRGNLLNYQIFLFFSTFFILTYAAYVFYFNIENKNFYGTIPLFRPIFVVFETLFPFLIAFYFSKRQSSWNGLVVLLFFFCLLGFVVIGKRGVVVLCALCLAAVFGRSKYILGPFLILTLLGVTSLKGEPEDFILLIVHAFFVHIREISLYTEFDGEYMGLTYIAGLFSWVPSELLEFKREFSLGKVTRILIGEGDDLYSSGGKRIGIFGEAYINFGFWFIPLIGVIYGFLSNLFLRKLRKIPLFIGLFLCLFFPLGFFESGSDMFLGWYVFLVFAVSLRINLISKKPKYRSL